MWNVQCRRIESLFENDVYYNMYISISASDKSMGYLQNK